jgi:predicted ArsR family transcriptional regulator
MPVAETSRWAFETVPLSERQQAVLAALMERGEMTDQQLAAHLGWPINCVTPRRGELVEAGLVARSRVEKSPLTMRPVSVWRLVNRQLEMFR